MLLAALDSIFGALKASRNGRYENAVFLSGLVTNSAVAGALTFLGDKLGVELYFAAIFASQQFRTTIANSVLWVVGSLIPQLVIGFALALWLRRRFIFRGVYQALIFFPWAVSGFLIGILFRWMFNGEFAVVNDLMMQAHRISTRIPWLADQKFALTVVSIAHAWSAAPL